MNPSAFRIFLVVFSLLVAVAAGAVPAAAQTTGGKILGTVSDPTGAVIPGAKITVTNEATGVSRTATSDSQGDFVLLEMAVGAYTVTVEAEGFRTNVRKGVILAVNQVLRLDSPMQIGTRDHVVEITDEPPLVDTTSTQVGAIVNSRAVTSLPLSGRDTYQLLQLQPGVQSQIGSDLFYGSDRAGVVSVNGGRGRANNFSVNGGDGNDQFANLPVIQPAPDTIQEFRVLSNTFDAEYGRNSGSVVNVVTKSGTNEVHGNVYEFFRNRVLNARGFFDVEKPDLNQNQFGGTLGGPIRKNRSFFFVSYEGRRVRRGTPSDNITVPTALERMGDYSTGTPFAGTLADANVATILNGRGTCAADVAGLGGAAVAAGTAYAAIFPTNVIPVSCFDATALDLMNQFVPPGNVAADLFQAVPIGRERTNQFTAKWDHKLTDSHQLAVYYYFNDSNLTKPFARFQAGGATLPGFGDLTDERFQQFNASHTWAISPTAVNEFRFTFFRAGQETFLHPLRTDLVTNSCATVPANMCFSDPLNPRLGITPGLGPDREGVPFIDVAGAFSIGNNLEGELPQTGKTWQWSESFSKVWGKHTMKFGADIRRQQFDQFLFFSVNGQYFLFGGGPNDVIYDNLIPNYLLGLADFYLQGAAQEERVRSTSYYLYAQDSWRIKSNLTLNYGLRWELNTPLEDIGQKVQTFRPGQDTAIYPCQLAAGNALIAVFGGNDCNPGGVADAVFPRGLVIPGDAGVPGGLTQTYYRSFAPRIGLNWSPGWSDGPMRALTGGPGKTSVKMGWGISYNPIEQLVLEQFSAEPPFGGSSGLANVMLNTPFLGQDGTVNPNPFNGILNPPRNQAVDWSVFRPILLFGQMQPDIRAQYSVQYNFIISRELPKNMVFQIGYVGTQGHRLLATHDLNFGNAQTCLDLDAIATAIADPALACGPFFADSSYFITAGSIPAGMTLTLPYGSVASVTGPNATDITLVGLRPFSSPLCQPTTGAGCPPDGVPVFSNIFAQDTIGNSNYNSLQVMLEKRFSGGLQFQVSYTWSKSIDNASSFESLLNPLNFRASRSLSLFDARHRFVYNYTWEVPWWKDATGVKKALLDGWEFSGIATFQSGFPIRITSSDDLELQLSIDFETPGQPDQVGPFRTLDPRAPGNQWFDPTAFAPGALGAIGNAPRTICCGPGILNADWAMHKRINVSESSRLELRAEFYNLWNHAQFVNPSGNITDGSDFGRIVRVREPRIIQVALKYHF